MGRTWEELSPDEQQIVAFMNKEGITADQLISRLRKAGKMSEEQLKRLRQDLNNIEALD